jgi:hypothetical protein
MAGRASAFGFALWILAWPGSIHAQESSILVNARTGAVLVSSEPTQPWPPASLTKLLTLYLTFAAIDAGSLKLDQKLEVSSHAAGQPGSRLGLAAGEEITVQQAILAVITRSGNDAAMVLAEAAGRSEAAFVAVMNSRAQALGLAQSHFVNPTGLPDPKQTTSARDMALLAQALWRDYPQHYHFFDARRMQFGQRDLPTINGFLASYRGADGLKTGTTCDAGYNLVASAERNGLRLIGVVLGAPDGVARSASMTTLLDKGFDSNTAESGVDVSAMRPVLADSRGGGRGVSACRIGTLSAPRLPPVLPGWGVILGVYAQEFHAQRAIDLAKVSLNLAADIGQPRVIALKHEKYFNALLVGLDEERATAACLALRRSGAYCIKLTPSELNNPDAVWRG